MFKRCPESVGGDSGFAILLMESVCYVKMDRWQQGPRKVTYMDAMDDFS